MRFPLASLALLVTEVYAGSRIWESASPLYQHVHNSTVGTNVEKRGMHLSPNPSLPDEIAKNAPGLWPNGVIPYCFADSAAKDNLAEWIAAGMALWHEKGLSSNFNMVKETSTKCALARRGIHYREHVLMIHFNSDPAIHKFDTTVGKGKPDPAIGRKGPTMWLSLVGPTSKVDMLANVAHEIGHAFGLYHQHQATDSIGEPLIKIYCTELKSYDIYDRDPKKRTARDPNSRTGEMKVFSMDDICNKLPIAEAVGFPTSQLLPMNYGWAIKSSKIDWESIMLYPSFAGAKDNAISIRRYNPNYSVDDPEQEEYLQSDDSIIPYNKFPSSTDIDEINTMYPNVAKKVDQNERTIAHPESGDYQQFLGAFCEPGP